MYPEDLKLIRIMVSVMVTAMLVMIVSISINTCNISKQPKPVNSYNMQVQK